MIREAATCWFLYEKDSMFGFCPSLGEWCLWSAVIDGKRNYFSGVLHQRDDDTLYVMWDAHGAVPVDDSLYFARVIKLPAQGEKTHTERAKSERTRFDEFMGELRAFDEGMFDEMGGYIVWAQMKALQERSKL